MSWGNPNASMNSIATMNPTIDATRATLRRPASSGDLGPFQERLHEHEEQGDPGSDPDRSDLEQEIEPLIVEHT